MDLQTLRARLSQYLAAEAAALARQEYTIDVEGGSRRVRFADLPQIRAGIEKLRGDIAAAENAANRRSRVRYVRPRVR